MIYKTLRRKLKIEQHKPQNEPFSAISWRWQTKFDYDDARFVLDQHIEFKFFSHSSLKQCAGRLVPPLGHIILTPSQPVMQYPSSLVLCVKRGTIEIQFFFILKTFVLYGGVESFWIWMKDYLRWRDTVSGSLDKGYMRWTDTVRGSLDKGSMRCPDTVRGSLDKGYLRWPDTVRGSLDKCYMRWPDTVRGSLDKDYMRWPDTASGSLDKDCMRWPDTVRGSLDKGYLRWRDTASGSLDEGYLRWPDTGSGSLDKGYLRWRYAVSGSLDKGFWYSMLIIG